jgi:hypothetical protein
MMAQTTIAGPALDRSPQRLARTAALLFLIVTVAGIVAQVFISDTLTVTGDAAATAANILKQEGLFRLGFTIYLIEMASQVAQITALYFLLKPAGRGLAVLALVFGLVGCTIKTLSRLFYITPLFVLSGDFLSVFSLEQRQALALLLLGINDQAAGMALAFFGLSTLLNGILEFQSGFLPRFLGALSILGGLGWLSFLYPPLGQQLLPVVLGFGLVGGAVETLWLLIKGVDVVEWARRASDMT